VTCRCSNNGGCLIYAEKGIVLPIHYPSLLQLTLWTCIGSLNPLIVLRILLGWSKLLHLVGVADFLLKNFMRFVLTSTLEKPRG
jgi:hypothetical protein